MPTSGAAIMQSGENLLYLAKKEQCLSSWTQLRTLFKISDYKIYRIFPNSEVQYLHPKDGVFPEKLNRRTCWCWKRWSFYWKKSTTC